MKSRDIQVSLFEMSMCLSNAVDLVSHALVDHHKRVAYIASSIAVEMGLSLEIQKDLVMAGLLHDIGAISLKERLDAMDFELDATHPHAELGYRLIKTFEPFSDIAPLVRYHHLSWKNGAASVFRGEKIPFASQILHLADRTAVLINMEEEILKQSMNICKRIMNDSGEKFVPEMANIFLSISRKESFWFDVVSSSISQIIAESISAATIELNIEELLSLARLFGKIIDFRSRFTATHSSGVAATSETLAKLSGLLGQECRLIKIAGYLHDLGKLSIPPEILEKPGKLSATENNIIKHHSYYTFRTIETVKGLDIINAWASFHHECLDGTGYPFHLKGENLPLGSRIMAVADVFTAITEDRPYRLGMSKEKALYTLQQMAGDFALDPDIVSVLEQNYDEINAIRITAQSEESREYEEFRSQA